MCGDKTEDFFEKIVTGKDLTKGSAPFGTTLRIFNLQKGEKGKPWKEMIVGNLADPNIWAWDVKREEGKVYTAGYDRNVYICTGAGDMLDQAIEAMFEVDKRIVFDSGFSLEKHDLYDKEFPENILHRYEVLSELE
jgi:hypothetical protein